jgi:N-acetylneuraminate synthase
MEEFLIHLSDTLSKLDNEQVIHILGNGESKHEAATDASAEKDLFIQINGTLPKLKNLFLIATRQQHLNNLQNSNNENFILAPETFNSQLPFIKVEIADTAYIEGLLNVNKIPQFRFDFVLITILEILQHSAAQSQTVLNISLSGFDMMNQNNLTLTENDRYLDALLKTQKNIFELILSNKTLYPNLKIKSKHQYRPEKIEFKISNKRLSQKAYDVTRLNLINNNLLEDTLVNKTANTPVVVAELTNNHLGDLDRLIEMVDLSIDQGADVIKIQKRNPSEKV